jgi:hypothetical protein
MTLRYLGPLAALALLTACGADPAPHGAPGLGPGVDPAGRITLTVHTSQALMFTEGAVPEVRLTAPDGTGLSPEKDHVDDAVFSGLDAGRYQVQAALRPCDGNCGYLDPPTLTCEAAVVVKADRSVTVRWRRPASLPGARHLTADAARGPARQGGVTAQPLHHAVVTALIQSATWAGSCGRAASCTATSVTA